MNHPPYLHGSAIDSFDARKELALDELECQRGQPRTMPSRQFLVQQAVLNAVTKEMPENVKERGAAATLWWLQEHAWIDGKHGLFLQDSINHEFNKLVETYA